MTDKTTPAGMQEALKPCPFCGDEEPKFDADERGFTAYLCVRCLKCGARADAVTYSTRENGIDHDSDERYVPPQYQKDAATRRWNTRSTPAAPQVTSNTQEDALRKALELARSTLADCGQQDTDNWPTMQAVCAALSNTQEPSRPLVSSGDQGWQPITSAPKDGTVIVIGWFPLPEKHSTHCPTVVQFLGDSWVNMHHGSMTAEGRFAPTHWMPLPSAPNAEAPTQAEGAARSWDAAQIKQPNWAHVEAAFIEGAREAKANPEADDAMFRRAADGYTKRVFEHVDPVSEAALRTESWAINPNESAGQEAQGVPDWNLLVGNLVAATVAECESHDQDESDAEKDAAADRFIRAKDKLLRHIAASAALLSECRNGLDQCAHEVCRHWEADALVKRIDAALAAHPEGKTL